MIFCGYHTRFEIQETLCCGSIIHAKNKQWKSTNYESNNHFLAHEVYFEDFLIYPQDITYEFPIVLYSQIQIFHGSFYP